MSTTDGVASGRAGVAGPDAALGDGSGANTDDTEAPSSPGRAGPTMLFGRFRFWLVMVGVVTVLAGVLFGYDQGIISGALPFITQAFQLSSTMAEVVTSWVTLGALFGALAAGLLADRIGRRRTLLIGGLLFVVGAIVSGLAPDTAVLVIARFVIGLGVGVASVAAPLYAAEMAPAERRGRFVSTYQLAITIGILVAYIVDDLLTPSGSWRLMLAGAAIVGLVFIIALAPMPESPRWLMQRGRRSDAARALGRVRGAAEVETDLDDIQAQVADSADQASWKEIFGKGLRRPLTVGVGLAVFQQITGINAIIYYANEIFADAGFTTPQQQARATLYAVGVVNVLATLIAVAYVDRFGRRPLLLAGLVGMTVSLATVGFAFLAFDERDTSQGPSTVGILTVVCLVVFIASFAFSLGPVVWTVINEIYPTRVRGRMVSVATAVNWFSAFLVSQFFLTLVDGVGTAATFWLFALAGVVAFVWIWKRVPETKGLTLEEVQEIWEHGDPVAFTREAHHPQHPGHRPPRNR